MFTPEELRSWSNNDLMDVYEARLRDESVTDTDALLSDSAELAAFREKQKDLMLIRQEIFRRLEYKK